MADVVSRSVIELTTGVGLLREFEQLKGGARGVDSEFEKLRRRVQDVGGELRRTVERFSGRTLIDEAQRVAQAVAQIGGAGKLTDRELKDVQATIGQATEKLRRMGEEVPPSIRKLNAELKGLDDAGKKANSGGVSQLLGGLGSLKSLLPAMGAAGALTFIGALGSQALASADAVVKFSQQTGTSIETTQRWQYVAEQTSSSLEAFAANAYKLGINVASGTEKVRDATKDLGLAYGDLRAMKPEQQFDAVMAALSRVEDVTERNRLGQAMFGKQWKEISAAAAEDYRKLADAAEVSSDQQIKALEEAGDEIAKFHRKIKNAVTGWYANAILAAQGINTLGTGITDLTAAEQAQIAFLKKSGGDVDTYVEAITTWRIAEEHRKKATEEAAAATTKGAAAQRDYSAELVAVRAELAKLKPAQRKQLDDAIELEGVSEELAGAFGLTEDALRLYQSSTKEATKTTNELAQAKARLAERSKQAAANILLEERLQRLAGTRVRADMVATNAELAEHIAALDRTETSYFGIIPAVQGWQGALVPLKGTVTEVNGEIVQQAQDLKVLDARMKEVGRTVGQILVQAFTGGGGLDGALKALGALGGQKLGEHLGKSLAQSLGGKLGTILGGLAGPLGAALGALGGSLLGKLFGGGEGKKVNDLRDKFVEAAGGIHELNVRAQAAGLTLDRILKAKTVKEYEAAVKELEAAFKRLDEQKAKNQASANELFSDIIAAGRDGIPAAMRATIERFIELGLLTEDQIAQLRGLGDAGALSIEKMDEALALFNGRVEALGPAYAQAKIDETSAKYINAIDYATKHGASLDQMLHDAKEELSALVVESLKSGTTLPANMKPWIESLAAQGKLIDENGNKIEDLSGINWGPEMKTEAQIAQEGWDRIIEKIEDLIELITGPLEDSLDDVTRDRTIRVGVKYDDGVTPGPETDAGYSSRAGMGAGPSVRGASLAMPPVDRLIPRSAAPAVSARMGLGPSSTITTSTSATNVLGIIMGQQLSPRQIGRAAVRYMAEQGLPFNEAGVSSGIEKVVARYLTTYGAAGAGAR